MDCCVVVGIWYENADVQFGVPLCEFCVRVFGLYVTDMVLVFRSVTCFKFAFF